MLNSLNYKNINFISSYLNINDLPIDNFIEIALIGKSNVGKSSILNILSNKKNLAKFSKTPGSTEFINLFEISEKIRIIDLPGYGYLKNFKKKNKIQNLLNLYLKYRKNLKALIILIDIRRFISYKDKKILLWAKYYKIPFCIFLTKSDKFSKKQSKEKLYKIKKLINNYFNDYYININIFSSFNKIGLKFLKKIINIWYQDISFYSSIELIRKSPKI
ncbi:ribosome biogenesis GTP-binding protein YihA/YsxC [Sodalis-like secondary symbiont of Drepanosiphum platanoidis]|uniref:ribosome biogenesis GTP-binding protein YihA/YsxC n=1 Tax=Sodalis-like secondary symbiont of Drepanosiphum platanoidis TaxID=2994493 RepID=UPI003463AE1E